MSDQWGEVKALIIKLEFLGIGPDIWAPPDWRTSLRRWKHSGASPQWAEQFLRNHLPPEFKTET